jgi:predicted dehydrogenase
LWLFVPALGKFNKAMQKASEIVAVLGLGSIGLRHARNLIDLGVEVHGFDPSLERRCALQRLGGYAGTSQGDTIDAANAVVIASPNKFHLGQLAMSIDAGQDVFVEKPLAHTTDGLDELLAIAEVRGLIVFVGHNLRFNPAVQAAKAMLEDDAIGEPYWARFVCASYLPTWRPQQDHRQGYTTDPLTGGVIFDLTHEFDLANYLLGPAKTVAAVARNTDSLGIAAEDTAEIVLRHERGLHSSMHLDYVSRPPRREFEITGNKGALRVDVRGRAARLLDIDGCVRREDGWESTADQEYRAEMRHFLRCVRRAEEPVCSGHDGLAVLRQVVSARALSELPTA